MQTDKNGGPNNLRAWRLHRKLTLEELAERVGTTAGVIHYLEEGTRGLSAKWLRKLAPALDTTPGYLLDLKPEEVPADIIDLWSHISDREKPRARRVLETFKTGTDD
jgi:transcriptional regulator with XRE-family HTH domain